MSHIIATQRIVLHTDCLDDMKKGTLQKLEYYEVEYGYEDEPGNKALSSYECPLVIIIRAAYDSFL